MTNEQVLILANGLGNISPPDMIGSFNYAISENLQNAVRIAKNIREYIKDSDPIREYKKKVKELQEKHAAKDEDDKPVQIVVSLPNGAKITQYDIPAAKDPKSEYRVKLDELNEKYDKDIKEQDKRLEFLKEESEQFEPWWIVVYDIPDGLSREEMNLVHLLVEKPKR